MRSVDEVIRAYEEQMAAIEKAGGRLIVMASRALARVAKSPADYERVYARVLSQAREPVIIHWLGEMFDPALAGYWGNADHMAAMETAVGIINAHAAKVDGVKISLLDKDKEIVMRRQLAKGVRMYTGDDFNYAELIAGDEQGLQRRAARHLRRHRAGRLRRARGARPPATAQRFDDILEPTVPLSRHIFKAPTRFYKTGVVFMAYLNGLQDHFVMVGGQQSARSLAASGRAVPPRRPRRPAARSRARPPAHGRACWPCTGSPDARLLAGDLAAPVDQHGDGAQAARAARHHRGVRAARHPRHLSLARPGARRRPRRRPPGSSRMPASGSPAIAAAASSRPPMPRA